MARDDLSALLRRGRDLFRLRDGDDVGDPAQKVLWPRELHHDAAFAQHGEDNARDRVDCRVWLHDGDVHRVVQRQLGRLAFGGDGDVQPI